MVMLKEFKRKLKVAKGIWEEELPHNLCANSTKLY